MENRVLKFRDGQPCPRKYYNFIIENFIISNHPYFTDKHIHGKYIVFKMGNLKYRIHAHENNTFTCVVINLDDYHKRIEQHNSISSSELISKLKCKLSRTQMTNVKQFIGRNK